MLKFIHAADIHLDSPLKGLERYEGAPVEEVRQATRRAMENLVQLAIDQAAAFVLIAGDLYDGDWRDQRTGLFFVAQMAKLREAGIRVFVIAGNHDAANKMTRTLPLPDNVHMFSHRKPETVVLDELGIAVHGQSFARAAVTTDLSANYPAAVTGMFNVGLLHTSATGREGHENYSPCTLDGLRAKQYDYWALGHVHAREVLCEEPWVVFPGNVQGRHIRETGPKGCTLVTVDDRSHATLEPYHLDVLRWQTCAVDVTGAETSDEVLDQVRHELSCLASAADGLPLAVRVELRGACAAHRQIAAAPRQFVDDVRATALDVGGDVWIEKVKRHTASPVDLAAMAVADGPLGELVELIEQLKTSPDELQAILGSDLKTLNKKLPAELTEQSDLLNVAEQQSGEQSADLLEEVGQMLVRRLSAREDAS